MESEKLRYFFKVGVFLAVFSVAFHLIAFTSNGWFIATTDNKTFRAGIWSLTTCHRNGGCKTVSKREQYEGYKSVSAMIAYSDVVRNQVVSTIELCCLLICVVMFAIALCKHSYDRRTRIVILSCSTLSGVLIVHELGIKIRDVQRSIQLLGNDFTVYFPWSLVMLFFAALLILSVSCLCFIMEWTMLQRGNQQLEPSIQQGNGQFQQSRHMAIRGILFNVFSITFRIVAFASNAWRIIDNSYATTYFGLWFMTKCIKNGDCETMSMKKYFEDIWYIQNVGLGGKYEYSFQVRSQVVLTLLLLLSMVCILLLLIETRQLHNNRLMRLCVMLSSLISGTFWLYDVGYYMRIFVIDFENSSDYKIAYFPWSILFGFFGTILILIFSFIHFVKECQIKEMDHGELENTPPMTFSENNGSSNAEGTLSENNVVTHEKT